MQIFHWRWRPNAKTQFIHVTILVNYSHQQLLLLLWILSRICCDIQISTMTFSFFSSDVYKFAAACCDLCDEMLEFMTRRNKTRTRWCLVHNVMRNKKIVLIEKSWNNKQSSLVKLRLAVAQNNNIFNQYLSPFWSIFLFSIDNKLGFWN